MIQVYKKLWYIFTPHERKRALQLLILMILMAFLEILGVGSIMPFLAVLGNPDTIETNKYLHTIYSYFKFESKESFLIFLGTFAFLMLLGSAAMRSITSYAKFRFSNLRRHSLGQKLLKKYLHQPYSFFLSRNSSDISKTILSETDIVVGNALLPVLNLLTYTILTIALVVFFIVIDPILAFILGTIFGLFYIIMYATVNKYLGKIGHKRAYANSQRFKIITETIGGIKDLKVLGKEQIYLENFIKPSYEFSHYSSVNATISEVPQFLIEVIAFGTLLAMVMYKLTTDNASLGSLLPILGLYALGALKLKPAVNNIYSSLAVMKFGISSIENIIKDLIEPLEHANIENDNQRLILKNKLQLKDISFTYSNTVNPVLKNISLEIDANTTVGIIGTTGAGKSTLIDIILGLLQPTSGQIIVDAQKLDKSNVRQWQNVIGYVPQSIFLTDDTIANNIAFGVEKDDINLTQVYHVAQMAQIHDFISTLHNGYNTFVGERGIRLSGGQRQRLGIARALYHNPELLLLDEATSALDSSTEADVMKAIESMSGSKTIIIVAHRLTTIENCDYIIHLDNGRIINEEKS